MTNTEVSKRALLFLAAGGGAAATAALVASCTPQQVADVQAEVAKLIGEVQAGVVAACAAVGKLVPTANTVFLVLSSIVGSSTVIGAAMATATLIAQAIAAIAAIGCPAAPPTPAPAAAPTPRGTASVNGKSVPVVFY
jgi:hypothetical protein